MKLLFTVLFSAWCLRVAAQPGGEPIAFEQVVPPGLIRSAEIHDLVQDKEGLLWVAANGLFAYDGYRFQQYSTLNDSVSIISQQITSLLYDAWHRRVLIGTRTLGVLAFDYESNRLYKLPSAVGTPIINQLVQDATGTVWIASFNSGLFTLRQDTLHRAVVTGYKSIRTSFLLPHKKQLLVGDLRKVYVVENYQVTDSIILQWDDIDFSTLGRVTALCVTRQQKLYIGTERLGVLVYDFPSRTFVHYFKPETAPFFNRINRILEDRNNNIWILTKAGGVVLFNPASGKLTKIIRNPWIPYTLSSDNCNAILEDHTGIIWIAASGALNKYDPAKILFRHITYDPNNPNSLSDKMVRCLYEDTDGTLIIGTDGGFLNFLDPVNASIKRLKITVPGYTRNFMPASIRGFDKDKLIVGTSSGILIFNKSDQTFRYYPSMHKELKELLVRQIEQDEHHLYMIAGGSFWIMNIKTGRWKVYKTFGDTSGENPVFGATAIYVDRYKLIWIGAQGGISLFNSDSSFTHFAVEKDSRRPDDSYLMILAMKEIDGYLWISTFNYGLWRLRLTQNDQHLQQIERVHIPELNQSTAYCTLPDKEGMIWITSNQGLLKYNPVTGHLLTFLPEQGVQALEFNRLAFLETKKGEFVMGGINGINIFRPEEIKTKVSLPRPVLLHASSFRGAENQYYINLRDKKEITLMRDQNFVIFHYIVNDFHTPRHYLIEYLLEGYDPRWIEATSSEISFTNLKPGTYTLRLRTRVNKNTNESTALHIKIPFPVWQQRWFIITVVVITFGLIISGFRIQASVNRRNKEKLEQLLRERTAQIEKSRAELQALNEKKDFIFSILSHDLRSPLTTLAGFLSILEENVKAFNEQQLAQYARNIRNSVNSALDLIDNTLYWALSQTGSIKQVPGEISVNDILKKIYNLYELTAARKRINLKLEITSNIKAYADENMIYVALRNVVSNAIKFTPEGKSVILSTGLNHQRAMVSVKDEGIGMNSEYVQRVLNQEHVSLKKGTANEKGTGLGLVLCRKFLEMNNGSLEIISAENQGTEFRIYLPLPEEDRK